MNDHPIIDRPITPANNGTIMPLDPPGAEPFRPRFHYTPLRNWMNDPNGLVYHAGEYHLFYQYNPHGSQWGHMSWGHAVSADLVHWRELPVAIPETDHMIFSGSAVVDRHNVTMLGDGAAPPMIAAFTGYHVARNIQAQHLAYSHDHGRTWTHYDGNPVIDRDHPNFRDPKLFFHEPSQAWIMIAVLATDHRALIYRSQNLIDWALASEFGPVGATSGQWECPDLFEVPVEDTPATYRWVLKVDIDDGFVDGGSGAQYFIGNFDGYRFTIDTDVAPGEGCVVDFGTDFYAAITWDGLPETQPGPVWIGWMSNHQSGRLYPTEPWRGLQSVPRRLFLFAEAGQLKLGQQPIGAISQLRMAEATLAACPLQNSPTIIAPAATSFEAKIGLQLAPTGIVTLAITDRKGPLMTVRLDAGQGTIAFARMVTTPALTKAFGRHMTTDMPAFATIDLQILFDASVIEIFVNGGRRVYSACLFPSGNVNLAITADQGEAHLASASWWEMTAAIAR